MSAANNFGPARVDFREDMACFDRLPVEVRAIVRDAPVNFGLPTILAVWRLHEFDGGSVRDFCRKLRRKMRQSMAEAMG